MAGEEKESGRKDWMDGLREIGKDVTEQLRRMERELSGIREIMERKEERKRREKRWKR
ncbi:PREDICTED: uncharacterized protein LOC105568281, partial [Vollenhovia emeryi]|uniref:uncharacterized protein LOC105568281 n=1 Tax=Vollenhovia emeryi TaxID=411798 RepID=UPI0005F53A54